MFIKFLAHTEKVEKYQSWTDYLPEEKLGFSNIHVKAGRILFRCTDIEAAQLPKKIDISDLATANKLKALFNNAIDRLILSSATSITLEP